MSTQPYSWTMQQDEDVTVITLFDETGEEAVKHKCSPANAHIIDNLKEQVAHLRADNAALRKQLSEVIAKI